MKTIRIAIAVLGLLGAAFGQVNTTCTAYGNTVQCTSTDTGAAIAERNREYAQAGNQLGQALGAGLLRLRARHAEASEGKAWRKEQAKRAKTWCQAIGTPHATNPYTGTHCN